MGDSEQRLILGMNAGDGRQTPPGQLQASGDDGDEPGAAVSESVCDDEDSRAPPKSEEGVEEEEEELDPRIQEELEHLNQANEEINRVELQLDVSKGSFFPFPFHAPLIRAPCWSSAGAAEVRPAPQWSPSSSPCQF
nr:PREDICTED: SH3 domain-binding protein 5-like [Struthio camelus australis]